MAIFGYYPGALDVSGAVIVVLSALALTFERKIVSGTSRLWRRCSDRSVTIIFTVPIQIAISKFVCTC